MELADSSICPLCALTSEAPMEEAADSANVTNRGRAGGTPGTKAAHSVSVLYSPRRGKEMVPGDEASEGS